MSASAYNVTPWCPKRFDIALSARAIKVSVSNGSMVQNGSDPGRRRRPHGNDLHTWCPYKGEASYYDIVRTDADRTDLTAAVWYYDDPFPAVADIEGHVAFYADRVAITTSPGEQAVR
jgi:hypothetical protein